MLILLSCLSSTLILSITPAGDNVVFFLTSPIIIPNCVLIVKNKNFFLFSQKYGTEGENDDKNPIGNEDYHQHVSLQPLLKLVYLGRHRFLLLTSHFLSLLRLH